MNNIMNDIVNVSFAHKPDGLLFTWPPDFQTLHKSFTGFVKYELRYICAVNDKHFNTLSYSVWIILSLSTMVVQLFFFNKHIYISTWNPLPDKCLPLTMHLRWPEAKAMVNWDCVFSLSRSASVNAALGVCFTSGPMKIILGAHLHWAKAKSFFWPFPLLNTKSKVELSKNLLRSDYVFTISQCKWTLRVHSHLRFITRLRLWFFSMGWIAIANYNKKMGTQPTLEPNGNRNCVINRRCELTIILSRPYYVYLYLFVTFERNFSIKTKTNGTSLKRPPFVNDHFYF